MPKERRNTTIAYISTISEKLKTEPEIEDNENDIHYLSNGYGLDENKVKSLIEHDIHDLSNKHDLHENLVKSLIETFPEEPFENLMQVLSATSDRPYSDKDQFASLYAKEKF
ncbi:11611_t:CDS:2 [Diversispora eburnea]|uniref:11611_t:CDS:1 n=1 Tax=Diversispora eburnea TaxID=1213867 RepID=A0A9N9BRL5_9GLOM|nr:11611_t:CDS:2 [Diversispora eburnea]